MSVLTAKLGGCAIGLACLLANPSARADIIFCNNFPHLIYIAIAYPQDDGSWITRGWLNVDTGQCSEFDSALRVKTFYYRAESVPFRAGGHQVTISGAEATRNSRFGRTAISIIGTRKRRS